ncbi:hypothetical protein D9756_000749 [Leucocoprinus leucothites]|uniref:Uncharacterized protein n=1 Tax=Leucocoprinus leucothites TaxID=201217 RepID=A0A8H5GFA1_9AGAR|nr:hypothetical protein D9756_000749 [Leucoagaricus leucothites]
MSFEQQLSYYVCDDILEEIASYLPLGDKKTLSLARHSARELLQPSLFRTVCFDIPSERDITAEYIAKFESEVAFLSTPRFATAVRACQIALSDSYNEPHTVISSDSKAICMLNRTFELLASFHWLEQLALCGVDMSPQHWAVIGALDRLEQLLCQHCSFSGGIEFPIAPPSLRLFAMNPRHTPINPSIATSFDWVPRIPENVRSLELHNQNPTMVQYFTNNAIIYSHLTSLHYTVTQDEFDAYTPFLLSLFKYFPSLQELSFESSSVYLPKLEPVVMEADSHLPRLAIYKGPADLLGKLVGDGSPIRHILPRYPEYTSTQIIVDAFSCEQLAKIESLQLKILRIPDLVPIVENFKGLQALAISMDYYDVPSYSTCRDLLCSIEETVRSANASVRYLWLHITTPQSKTYGGEQRLQRDAFFSFCLDMFVRLEYVSVSGDKNWRRNKATGAFEATSDEIFFDDWRRARQGHLNWNHQKSICFNTF